MIIGVGVDIESVERFRRMKPEVFERFLARVLTEREREYCLSKRDPYPHVAARVCAKEAFAKALGLENPWEVPFKDVEVLGKPPRLIASGRAAEILREKKSRAVHVSLSHTSEYAAAVVVIEA